MTLLIVSCGKVKRSRPAPAADLYIGPLFKDARRHATERRIPWLIFSALHGLVEPTRILDPYDMSMISRITGDQADRAAYMAQLRDQLAAALAQHRADQVELHAGADYADALRAVAPPHLDIYEPMKGYEIGERRRWYKQQPLFGWGR